MPEALLAKILPKADLFSVRVYKKPLLVFAAGRLGTFTAPEERALPWVDAVAAFEPRLPGARELWEEFGASGGMPRLCARVEAEILRQEMAEMSAAQMASTVGEEARVTEGGEKGDLGETQAQRSQRQDPARPAPQREIRRL